MATPIEARLEAEGTRNALGEALTPILTCPSITGPDGQEWAVREQYFYNGWFREVNGDAWLSSEASVAQVFVPPSA